MHAGRSMLMFRLAMAILAACAFEATAPALAAAQASGATVTGVVTAYASDEPIADATVSIYGPTLPGNTLATQTDGTGAFSFPNLAAGRYRIGASKQGFAVVNAGEPRYAAGGRAFALGVGDRHEVRLRLPRLGVITGRILDESGTPVVGASVRASSSDLSAGYRRTRDQMQATTDDRGVYRLHSLAPGIYGVCASAGMGRLFRLEGPQRLQRDIDYLRREIELATGPRVEAARERLALLEPQLPAQVEPVQGLVPACLTDATGTRATIDVRPDQERTDLDLRLMTARLARIEGRVSGFSFETAQNGAIRLINEDEQLGDGREWIRVFRDGRFLLRDVPPGRYAMVLMIESRTDGASRRNVAAAKPIVVTNDDLSGIVLEPPAMATIEGQVVLRGTGNPGPAERQRIEIRANPASQTAVTRQTGPYIARPDDTGRFTLTNVWPGSYRISAGAREPTNWFTDAITLAGRDVAVDPITIAPGQAVTDVAVTLTDRRASLAGTVLDETGEPAPEFLILIYPTDPRDWTVEAQRMRVTRASSDGDYVLPGLRPGSYRIVTLRDAPFGAWFEPAFLRDLEPKSLPVTIAGDGEIILNLKVASIER